MSFPNEMDRFPGRIWLVGTSRSRWPQARRDGHPPHVIHPKFAHFILLGTILVAAPVSSYGEPLDYSPCLEVQAGASRPARSGHQEGRRFDFVACSVHNYASSWACSPTGCRPSPTAPTPTISARASAIRERVDVAEPCFQGELQAAYCLAVCPAGEDVIEPYLDDSKGFMDLVLSRCRRRKETLYVLPNSEAKAHAERRYPHKQVKVVDSGSAAAKRGAPTFGRRIDGILCGNVVCPMHEDR